LPRRAAVTLPFTRCRYCRTPAIAIAQAACDVHDNDHDNDNNNDDNARQRGLLWPHGMGPINVKKREPKTGKWTKISCCMMPSPRVSLRCFTDPEASRPMCTNIEYFGQDSERPPVADTTNSILRSYYTINLFGSRACAKCRTELDCACIGRVSYIRISL